MKVLDRDGATSALFALGFRLVDSASLLETVRGVVYSVGSRVLGAGLVGCRA